MLKKIKDELDNIKMIKNEISTSLKMAPEGKLRCAINKGYAQYYIGNRYLRTEEKQKAVEIAQKEYNLKIDKLIRKYEHALETVQDIYRKLHPARKAIISPLYKPVEEVIEEFNQISYVGKAFDEMDQSSYYTMQGERVRSKSEKIIADELYRHGISYKYELPIELEVWNRKITVYPDFTALNKRTGKKWIIEHFGMMDNVGYFEATMQKIDTYEKNDILIGRDLIILHETSTKPLDTKVLEKYINEYLC